MIQSPVPPFQTMGEVCTRVLNIKLLVVHVVYFQQQSKMADNKFDVEQEFGRITNLIEDNTYPGDFSCSGRLFILIRCLYVFLKVFGRVLVYFPKCACQLNVPKV